MQKLHDLQADFAGAIHDPKRSVPEEVARQTDGQIAEKRFAVYRNNVYVSLIEALRTQFPIIERLVGEEFFKALARVYVEQNLPKSPLMFEYGDNFPAFLESFEKVQDLPYLADVARIDYARTQAYHAADATPLTLQDLAAVPQDIFALSSFTLHPSIHLISSPYPIFAIWDANMRTEAEMPEISIDDGGQDILVVRPELSVDVHLLAPGALHFVSALRDGETIAEAVETSIEKEPNFDFSNVLPVIAQAGILVDRNEPEGM